MEPSSIAGTAAAGEETQTGNSSTGLSSDADTTAPPPPHYTSHPLYLLSQGLDLYLLPLIFLLGVWGNLLTILIMRRLRTGDSALNLFFTALAAVDLSQLLLRTLWEWAMSALRFTFYDTHDAVCKLTFWGVTAGSTLSAWLLVCLTVHRALAVVWPHRVHALCTHRVVGAVMAGVAVFLAAVYCHYVVGFRTVYSPALGASVCSLPADDQRYVYFTRKVFVYIDLILYCLLPFVLLSAANSVLVWKLTQSVKAAGTVLSQGDAQRGKTREKAASSVTLTVIVVSMTFLVLTLPGSVEYILNYFEVRLYGGSGHQQAVRVLVSKVCGLFTNANSAVNFYLYCLTGRRFREECLQLLCCGRGRGRPGALH